MKLLLLLLMLLCITGRVVGDQSVNALDKSVSNCDPYTGFHEAIGQIEKSTGFRVSYPKELDLFMNSNLWWIAGGIPDKSTTRPDKITVTTFLDSICGYLHLKWKLDAQTNVVILDFPWRTSDSRPLSELWNLIEKQNYQKKEEWTRAFDALLSADTNFERAWRVRQRSCFEMGYSLSTLKLVQQITDTAGNKYVIVLLYQPCLMIPGHGSVEYYWFREDGILMGAGLMNTGNRCDFLDASVNNGYGSREKISNLHMVLKWGGGSFLLVRFVLDKTGLKLTHLVDEYGTDVRYDTPYFPGFDLGLGKSLLFPDKP